ncbi:alpha/beta fold hydrolase [Raineyella fluvialis]|uniref:Alpha/beta fold hydrolase n=1 Tax=Raineyella fluvialis TaxID=2662261 RepID=A0A5Q2F9T0_9ACTN|nr:alpha/beta fold hydrolase [Raineyella fluvialis]
MRPARRRRPWWWRATRALVGSVVGFVVLVTLASVVFNAVSRPASTLAAPSGADVTVDGTRVHYQRWGSQGTPIVLVHGFAESTLVWGPAAEVLARDHVVYAVDLAGYGYTEYSGHYTLDDQVALVDGFVRAMGLDHPILVGHSMGAAVVGGVALRHPSDVGGIVFVDGDGLPFADGNGRPRGRPAAGIIGTPYLVSAYRLVTRSTWLGGRLIESQCGSPCRGLTPGLVDQWLRPLRQGRRRPPYRAWRRAECCTSPRSSCGRSRCLAASCGEPTTCTRGAR